MAVVAVKDDGGKRRYDLLLAMRSALDAIVHTLEIGARKYGDFNWRREGGLSRGRLIAAIGRHLTAYAAGELNDLGDGQHHMAAVAVQAMFLLEKDCDSLLTEVVVPAYPGLEALDDIHRGFTSGPDL